MTFLALVAALLIEQVRALSAANPFYTAFRRFARRVERSLDGGRYQHGAAAWLLVVVPIVAVVAAAAIAMHRLGFLAAFALNVGVLYLTMGFRQFSHAYTEALDALRVADVARARASIERWHGVPADVLDANEIARLSIERGLFSAHRHVFGVIAWFAAFGAAGAVLYRIAAMLRDRWGVRGDVEASGFSRFSRDAFYWCDWVPARLTAVSFAIVGDFEDALFCWRTQARAWADRTQGIVLASGAGALGVRLGSAPGSIAPVETRPGTGMGEEADAELMTSAIGLIWRAAVLWLFVILLVTIASWLG